MYTYHDIARYAEEQMTVEERAAFERALTTDATLQQQLALYHEVHASLQQHFSGDAQREQLQQTLQNMRGAFFSTASQPAKVVPYKRFLLRATAVAAVLLAVVFIWQPWKADLFGRYAGTTMMPPVERGSDTDSLLQAATIAFNSEDFSKAALLSAVKQQDTANSFVDFYYGIALLQTGRLPEARTMFENIYAGESAFKYEAALYQSLTYIKENNNQVAVEWLEKIPADAPVYNKAQKLLKELE